MGRPIPSNPPPTLPLPLPPLFEKPEKQRRSRPPIRSCVTFRALIWLLAFCFNLFQSQLSPPIFPDRQQGKKAIIYLILWSKRDPVHPLPISFLQASLVDESLVEMILRLRILADLGGTRIGHLTREESRLESKIEMLIWEEGWGQMVGDGYKSSSRG